MSSIARDSSPSQTGIRLCCKRRVTASLSESNSEFQISTYSLATQPRLGQPTQIAPGVDAVVVAIAEDQLHAIALGIDGLHADVGRCHVDTPVQARSAALRAGAGGA